jgi:hypothetical protein
MGAGKKTNTNVIGNGLEVYLQITIWTRSFGIKLIFLFRSLEQNA